MVSAVLVLNVTYEPLPQMVSVHRAVCMVVAGDADIIESTEGKTFRSPSLTIPSPTVVKLRHYVKVPWTRRKIPVTSYNVQERDHHICAYCGGESGSMDHILPTSKGGQNTWMNTIASCIPCNSAKDNMLLEECGMTLRFPPTIPTGKSYLVVGWADREQQAKYLPEHMKV